MPNGLLPEGENLRKAVRWLAEQQDHSARTVQEAARRFDLSPADEEFLLRHFAETDRQDSKSD
ncbi:hypothetical protein MIN45_P0371 [Methylomarinovum tepidoasis]|uniref:Nif11 domain-containing protein n=1 Tax=Methylomarinovum tepidoasis TaxID=2840183 RepID=A0AAU9CV90_9GAMM|nr:hypothetical protein [Methylomarinovum sp. IN45]BCX88004.1 hypothetical protein MIN45_P0371 [Methylomarinovum sp. IN45]